MKALIGLLSLFILFSGIQNSGAGLLPQIQTTTKTRTTPTNPPPIITSFPISQITTQGNTVIFSISAKLPPGISGPKPALSFQWGIRAPNSFVTNIISSETNSTLTIPSAQYANQGDYYASVIYPGSYSTSTVAVLTVKTTNILAACSSNSLAGVAWDYSLTNDPAVTQFKVYYGTNTNSFSSKVVAVPRLSAVISNLLANNIYYIQVTALNTNTINSESPPSNQILGSFGYGCNVPFMIDIMMSANNVPRLTTKLCPNCSVTIYRSTDLVNWITIGAAVADPYGNVVFDDLNAPANAGFYRMTTGQ